MSVLLPLETCDYRPADTRCQYLALLPGMTKSPHVAPVVVRRFLRFATFKKLVMPEWHNYMDWLLVGGTKPDSTFPKPSAFPWPNVCTLPRGRDDAKRMSVTL